MGDRPQPVTVHRIRSTDLYADPAQFGFEPCGACSYTAEGEVSIRRGRRGTCFSCDGLGLVRTFPPCNGCGHCCLALACTEGRAAMAFRGQFPGEGGNARVRCAYLFWGGDRYWCGLAGNSHIAESLAIGEGCCQPLNSWRHNVRFRG
jgi:hypothetical protein